MYNVSKTQTNGTIYGESGDFLGIFQKGHEIKHSKKNDKTPLTN